MIANYLILASTVVLTVLANLIVKKGSLLVGDVAFSFRGIIGFMFFMAKNIYVLGGLVCLGTAFAMWVWLLSRVQLNVMYPISLGAQIVLLSIVSWLVFRESLTLVQIGGIVLIMSGIFLLLKPA